MEARVVVSRFRIEHVPPARSQRRAQRDGSEGGSADAEDYDVVVLAPGLDGKGGYLIEQGRVARKIHETNRAAGAKRIKAAFGVSECFRRLAPDFLVDPVRRDQH